MPSRERECGELPTPFDPCLAARPGRGLLFPLVHEQTLESSESLVPNRRLSRLDPDDFH